MGKFLKSILMIILPLAVLSCNIDEEIATRLPPKIQLDSETGIYTVKPGRDLLISPCYDSAVDAEYCWTMDGEVIGTSPSLLFHAEEPGQYYIIIAVRTDSGSDEEEIRVDVVALEIPYVSISGPDHQTIAAGASITLSASVRDTSLPPSLAWYVNGEMVSDSREFIFQTDVLGEYVVTAEASNEDGSSCDKITVNVVNPEDIPFVWDFERTSYHTVSGRKLMIKPVSSTSGKGVTYCWHLSGDEECLGNDPWLVFDAAEAGEYHIKASATVVEENQQITISYEFSVTVFEEGTFYRAKNSGSKAGWDKVYEYTPAPGQFINELKTGGFDGTQTTPEAAASYAAARMSQTKENGEPNPMWVSLGGFGGYIVVGFDHSIDNSGGYDVGILGNSFSGSSEPGIVWVMQDENGNGQPDDTWYELAGSETGKDGTIQDYAVTYYRPTGPKMPVQWTDNQGNSGEVDYLRQFHVQDYYYPLWIESDSYTLTGTCLNARNYDASGNGTYWVNVEYDWGYADNFSPIDRLTDDANAAASANANHFKISHAIDFRCEPVHLQFIDFIKVQVGVNAKSGWLGEVSTEVFGFYDCNMK